MALRFYLIAQPQMTDGMAKFLADQSENWQCEDNVSDGERLVEAAGRVCYMSFSSRQRRRRNDAYIANLVDQGHESVLEHANFSVLVLGLSRALSHQVVRHRAGFAYSQLSQQYHDESQAEFVEPAGLARYPEARRRWIQFMAEAKSVYKGLLAETIQKSGSTELSPKEQMRLNRSIARSVLPNATATALMITGNARAWRHVLVVRGSIHGDTEMRDYCVGVFELLSSAAPNLFSDFEIVKDSLGSLVRLRSNRDSL